MKDVGKIIEQMHTILKLHQEATLPNEPDSVWQKDVEALHETIAILSELQDAGINTLPALKRALQRLKFYKLKFDVPTPARKSDGVLHCPQCNGRVQRGHSFCHKCGKKLGWV